MTTKVNRDKLDYKLENILRKNLINAVSEILKQINVQKYTRVRNSSLTNQPSCDKNLHFEVFIKPVKPISCFHIPWMLYNKQQQDMSCALLYRSVIASVFVTYERLCFFKRLFPDRTLHNQFQSCQMF